MPPSDISTYVQLAKEHPQLTALLAGLVYALVLLAIMPKPHSGRRIVGILFGGYLFFAIFLLYLAKAVAAGAFGPEATTWLGIASDATAPEAAYGYLAFAAVAFLALWHNAGLRAAAVLAPAIYVLVPLLATTPTVDGLTAHAAEFISVTIGAVLLLLQAAVDRPVPPTSAHLPVAEAA